MAITFGVHIGPQNISIDDLRRLWRYADANGFKWISVWDHFYEAPPVDSTMDHFEALTLMAAIACETQNARIGNYVFCMAYRNPAVLTKALVCIDHLSGGRLEIGLGAGWHQPEHNAYGIPFLPPKQRLDMLEEGTIAIKSLLTNDVTDLHGTYFNLTNARMNPKPLQAKVPIWIGGQGEKRTLRIAARHADGWNVPYIAPELFQHKSEVLDMWCEKEGRDPATIDRSLNLSFNMVASDADSEAALARQRQMWGAQAEARAGGMLIGGPSTVTDQVGRFYDVGVRRLNIAFRPPVDWDALQAFVEEVMPRFSE
jgi:alkanesulfonate monooxygenase SsuD/methylene tetrahydromethanopterin reductase-like flavin-dependent oxidoreductase (luciferase family)